MTPAQFRAQNTVSYDEYQKIFKTYPHVASFGYWKPDYRQHTTAKEEEHYAKDLVVTSEAEFDRKLKGHLNKGAVFLGLNFGIRENEFKEDVSNLQSKPVEERLSILKQFNTMSNQYVKRSAYKNVYRAFSPYSQSGALDGDPRLFWGGYMTDLFKFNYDEDKSWVASGIPTHAASQLKADTDLATYNIEGLQHELHEVVGVPDHFFLFLMGSDVQKFKPELQTAFPNAVLFDMKHYASPTAAEEYVQYGHDVTEQAIQIIKSW